MSNNGAPMGAWAIIKWFDSGVEDERYFSFGSYDNEISEDFDSLGQRDDRIFFYCEDGEEQLKGLMGNNGEDFIVVSYQLEDAS